MRDQLRELCSSHRRPPEPINVIVGDLVVPKGHEPLLVLIGHRVIYQSATTYRQCLCTLARRQYLRPRFLQLLRPFLARSRYAAIRLLTSSSAAACSISGTFKPSALLAAGIVPDL